MATEREKMLAGEEYRADDPELNEASASARRWLQAFNRELDPDRSHGLLRERFASVGDGAFIVTPFHCDYGTNIHLGARSFLNAGGVILDCATVTIGDDVQMGPLVQLLTADHPRDPIRRRRGVESAHPITIGDNVWLGGGVIVLPGVSIGADTIVGAGSVVTRDLPAGVVAVGNPCRVRPPSS